MLNHLQNQLCPTQNTSRFRIDLTHFHSKITPPIPAPALFRGTNSESVRCNLGDPRKTPPIEYLSSLLLLPTSPSITFHSSQIFPSPSSPPSTPPQQPRLAMPPAFYLPSRAAQ